MNATDEQVRKRSRIEKLNVNSRDREQNSSRTDQQQLTHQNGVKDYTTLPGRSLLKQTLGHQNRQSSMIVGATSDIDPLLVYSLPWSAKGEFRGSNASETIRRASSAAYFVMRPDTQSEIDAELANLDTVESFVAPYGPELVNLYFRIVHPSFPILHKKVFLEKHGRSYRELTPCGLGAVYIMALNWWSYSPALATLPKPDAKELGNIVLGMLFEVHRRPKISDLQGGLVLTQCPGVNSWALTGHLVAMSQSLGINADCTDWQVPNWERGVRKRVAWAVFMQDKWGALVYGRGSHIRSEDWAVRALESTDFPETAKDDDDEEGSAEIEKGKQIYLHMVSLTEILADILDRFFTLKAAARVQTVEEILDQARPLQIKLKSWFSGIPGALSIDEAVPRKLSSVGYLHLAYYTAEVTLHRAILRSHTNPISNLEVCSITRHAAATRFTTALSFLQRLRAEHFQSFWYFSSTLSLVIIGVFAGILCETLSADDKAEQDLFMSKLAEYRWVLRISAPSADFLKDAVSILDARSQLLEQCLNTSTIRPFVPQIRSDLVYPQFEHEVSANKIGIGDGQIQDKPSGNGHILFDGNTSMPLIGDIEDWQRASEIQGLFDNFNWEDLADHQHYSSQFLETADVSHAI